ncbi:glycosyltransferase [Spirosoma litoris]
MHQNNSVTRHLHQEPLISIIITILNGGETLERCLLSIQNQLFADFELIIVDGGSKDNTLSIIEACYMPNKKLHVLAGAGLYQGLNTGINLSSGKWLYFMGADDELHEIYTLHKVAEEIKSIKKDTKVIVGDVNCVKQENILTPLFGSPYLMRHQVHHQGMFYKREVFDNLLYDETMRIASDYELNLKLALMGVPHQSMRIIVCNFGGDGISENQMKRGYKEMQQVHRHLFSVPGRYWVMGYFWFRRGIGAILRKYNFPIVRSSFKKIFG